MAKDEQPIDVNDVRADDEKINSAGNSGDPIIDALRRLGD